MYITSFGEITPNTLLRKKGSALGTLLKQDIFEAPNLAYAMKLYDNIYRKVDQILFDANHALSDDDNGYENVYVLRQECNDFFDIMSRGDVFNSIWRLDEERGNTRLFRDIDYDKGATFFPVLMRFFDLFHGRDFTDARKRVNEAVGAQSFEDFIISSMPEMEMAQDKMSYAKRRFHFISKYRYVRRRSQSAERKMKSKN